MEGTEFGRYRLIDLLGRGGMGEVWRAFDTGTNRHVAIKVLPAHLAQDAQFEARFRREADLAAGLNNPHIVPIYDYGEIDGRLFVSMRLVEGHDLAAELARGPLEVERAVQIVEHVSKALRAAHRAGLVHRDVKPSNILIDEDGDAYLIDFGIARAVADTGLTGTGTTIGTWAYMAPERFRASAQIDARVDIYALTCVLCECLTGTTPYGGTDLESIAAGHMFEPPPRPSLIRPGVPARLDDVIATGMAKDPHRRYPGSRELAAAARSAIAAPSQALPATEVIGYQSSEPTPYQPSTVMAAPPAPQPRRRRGLVIAAAAALAVAVVVVAAIAVSSNDDSALATTTTSVRTSAATTTTSAAAERRFGQQRDLPFTGLSQPFGMAVDGTGTVYVVDYANARVVMLAAGSGEPTVLPFAGLFHPNGVAVDGAGAVYVVDTGNDRVVKLAVGTGEQTVLPFNGLNTPIGVAVDAAGAVYVTDFDNGRVVMLAAGGEQTVLPFTGLDRPNGVAVDAAGAVYVTDYGNGRVVMLAAGSGEQTALPFGGLSHPSGVAIDGAGAVYVADFGNDRVVMLAAGSGEQEVLPFTGLSFPDGVAVDAGGSVYISDSGADRVIVLPTA